MSYLHRWLTFAWMVAAVASTSCSSVECPAGTADKQGQCVRLNAVEGDGGAAGGAADPGSAATGGGFAGSGGTSGGAASGGQGASSGSGANGAGSASLDPASAGSAGSAGGGGMGDAPGEACTTADALRCSTMGAGNRDKCTNGVWAADMPCPSGETCVTDPSGSPACVMVAELCRGSGGQTICDAQGSLVVCNADESIGMMMACESAKHCQAGMAAQVCATCIPAEQHQCTGVSLEQCAPDGMSFTKLMDCETEGLCNAMLGRCTDAVCEPGQKSCDGSKLLTCNADGTAVEGMETCANGMCDEEGGDCNQCQPGTKKCEGGMVATCDATGQTWQTAACPSSTPQCVGLGQCVQCAENEDCSDLTQGCKAGSCMQNRCVAVNAPNGRDCEAAGGKPGTCSSGSCQCTPQCGGKQCGDNGCGGSCGSCPGEMCNTGTGQCVECLDAGDCTDGDECQTASCSGGSCRYTDRNSGSCGTDGVCRSGSCCEPNCGSRQCGAPPNGCGTGECGGGCSGSDRCENGQCIAPAPVGKELYQRCTFGGDVLQGDCEEGLVCQTINTDGSYCFREDKGDCPQNFKSFLGVACLSTCDDTLPADQQIGTCPSPTGCVAGGWCVP